MGEFDKIDLLVLYNIHKENTYRLIYIYLLLYIYRKRIDFY